MHRRTLIAIGLLMLSSGLAIAQQPAAPPQDKGARSEIRLLRARLDALAKTADQKQAPPKQTDAVDRIARDLDALAARSAPQQDWIAWGIPLASLALSVGLAYWISASQRIRRDSEPIGSPLPAASGETDAENSQELSILARIRAKIAEVERDVRTYAGVYSLWSAHQSVRNAPLQRLAELSTREQEALLRYRTAAGELVALGYEFDGGDLGDWLAGWWESLDSSLAEDACSPENVQKREELFKTARAELKSLRNRGLRPAPTSAEPAKQE